MIRTLTLAAVAAAVLCAPASAQTVRVSTVGKTTEQLHADIAKAAKKVCRDASGGATFPIDVFASCYAVAMKDAKAQLADPAVAAAARLKLAQR